MKRLPALLLSVFALSAAIPFTAQSPGFVGIVGNWKTVDDGGPAFKVDTAGWSGTTDRAAIEPTVKSLFPTANDTFFTNATARQAFPLAVFSETKDFTGGTIRVQFKLVGGMTDQTAGIVFNLKPNGEYFFVRYNTAESNIAVWRYRNGARARVAPGATSAQFPVGAWHELAMTIDGSKLTATVNGGALKHEYTMTEPVSGRVGLWTKRDAITVFKNFKVTP
jgi:hypothetical protein